MNDKRLLEKIMVDTDVDQIKPPCQIVSVFGVREENGYEHKVAFKIDGWRKDKRHGAIEPDHPSRYGKSLYEAMFSRW